MELMIGAGLALALLYFWLLGHWFARVVMFLVLASVTFVTVAYTTQVRGDPMAGVLFGLLAAAVTWPIAGIPVYYWRHQFRQMLQPY
jgi:hypothetical protein